jgi:hypothetical protein
MAWTDISAEIFFSIVGLVQKVVHREHMVNETFFAVEKRKGNPYSSGGSAGRRGVSTHPISPDGGSSMLRVRIF